MDSTTVLLLPVCIRVTPASLLLHRSATAITATSYVRPQSSKGRVQLVWVVLQEAVWSSDTTWALKVLLP